MANFSKKFFFVVAFIFVVIASSFSLTSQETSQNVIKNGDIVGVLVKTDEELNITLKNMKADRLSCEFIVYKYNDTGMLEMLIGFWPETVNASKAMREEYVGRSWRVVMGYMKQNTVDADFIVWHRPDTL